MRNSFKFLSFLLISLCLSNISIGQESTLTVVPINTKNDNPYGFVEYLPEGYQAEGSKKWPLIVWLHGLGEDGDGSQSAVTNKILNKQISNWLKSNDVPFVIFSPQDPTGFFDHPRVENFVIWAKTHYNVDPNQVHMAGLSAGGYGIRKWIKELTEEYKKIATITPMSTNFNSGGFDETHRQSLVDEGIYAWFHSGANDKDPNSTNQLRKTHEYMYNQDANSSRLTEYIGVGHSAWEEVYDNSGRSKSQTTGMTSGAGGSTPAPYYEWTENDISWYEWLLSHPKKGTESAPSDIILSQSIIENDLSPSSTVAKLSAVGTPLFTFVLVTGEGDTDNGDFEIEEDNLILKDGSNKDIKASYSFRLNVTSPHGSFEEAFTLSVIDPEKTLLTVRANDKETVFDEAIPTLTISYEGFIDGDNENDLETTPMASTVATSTSDAGSYAITVDGGVSSKYDFSYTNGTLTISKADQTISLDAISEQRVTTEYVLIEAETSSGLDLTYELVDGPATIKGDTLFLTGASGMVNFTVNQGGNNNYNSTQESGSFLVSKLDQTISVDVISEQSVNTDYVLIEAEASSGLNLTYELVDGPATIMGDTLFLTGEPGTISFIVKQAGNSTYNSAEESGSFTIIALGLSKKLSIIEVYPNPVSEKLTLKVPSTFIDSEYGIFTLTGKRIFEGLFRTKKEEIDVSTYHSGVYLLKISHKEEVSLQFIKQ